MADTWWSDWRRLTQEQRQAFLAARDKFVEGVKAGEFQPGLRVKPMQAFSGVWEMTWAGDGRATFAYGPEVVPGEKHIIWRRIGGHGIFRQP